MIKRKRLSRITKPLSFVPDEVNLKIKLPKLFLILLVMIFEFILL